MCWLPVPITNQSHPTPYPQRARPLKSGLSLPDTMGFLALERATSIQQRPLTGRKQLFPLFLRALRGYSVSSVVSLFPTPHSPLSISLYYKEIENFSY